MPSYPYAHLPRCAHRPGPGVVLSYRARHRRRHPVAAAASPVVLAAVGLTMGAAQGPAASAGAVPVAVSRPLPIVAQPLDAKPVTAVPLEDSAASPKLSHVRHAKPPAAT